MELKIKGKIVTSLKVKISKNPSHHILKKTNKNYDKRQIFGYHDASKIYGAPKLCTCYVVKPLDSRFQRGSAKSPLAPSVLNLYG